MPGLASVQIQIYLALIDGYYSKNGLDVTLTQVPSSFTAGVVSGQFDVAYGGVASLFPVANQGQNAKFFYAINGGGSTGFIVSGKSSVTKPTDCKTLSEFSVSSAAYAYAINYQKIFSATWKMTNYTDPAAVVAGVVSGQSDCSVGTYSVYQTAIAQGKLHVIFDPSDAQSLPANWPKGSLLDGAFWGLASHLADRRSAIQKLIKALDQTWNEDMKKLSADQIATKLRTNSDFQTQSQQALADGVTHSLGFVYYNRGYIPSQQWPQVLDFYRSAGLDYLNQADAKWSYASRCDMSAYESQLGKPKL